MGIRLLEWPMMLRDDGLADMIGRIYDATLDPALWPGVWEAVVRDFDAMTGCFLHLPGPGHLPERLSMPGWSPQALALYETHFHRADVWAERSLRRPTLRAELGEDLVSRDDWERSEIWNDFSRSELGAYHLLGAVVPFGKDGVWLAGIHRPRDGRAFDEDDRRRLSAMLPHLARGLRLRQRLGGAEQREQLGHAALDALAVGVVIVTGAAQVVFANAAAGAIARDGETLEFGRHGFGLTSCANGTGARLRRLIADAAGGGAGGEVLVPRASGRRPVAVLVSRLPEAGAGDGSGDRGGAAGGPGHALLLLHDLDRRPAPAGALLRGLFGATAAEADLAERLMDGASLREITDLRGVCISTLRTQLSRLLARTDTRSQSALLKLLARLGNRSDAPAGPSLVQ